MKRLVLLLPLFGLAACNTSSSSAAACTTFTDLTTTTATISFGGTLGNNYVPRCAMVKLNQAVTFSGDFAIHPISQTSGPAVIPHTASGMTLTVHFPTAATYEYQCDAHHALGMTGAVKAVP